MFDNDKNLNMQVMRLCQRFDRQIVEIQRSVSSNGPVTLRFDAKRWSEYMAADVAYVGILAILTAAESQPDNESDTPLPTELDAPKTQPQTFPIPEAPDNPVLNNESVGEIRDTLLTVRNNLAKSGSAQYPYGITDADKTRVLDGLKIIASLIKYASTIEPLDYVETTPKNPTPVTN